MPTPKPDPNHPNPNPDPKPHPGQVRPLTLLTEDMLKRVNAAAIDVQGKADEVRYGVRLSV